MCIRDRHRADPRIARLLPDHLERRQEAAAGEGAQLVGDHDRAGVDEGVAGPAVAVLEFGERAERRLRRLPADVGPDVGLQLQQCREREELRDALQLSLIHI